MADKEKSAELILKLYDLRREALMREARSWFISFNPESFDDLLAAARGPQNAFFRMVTTYWDMACSLVNHGAIDAEMFNDANQEHVFVFAKIHPYIAKLREMTGPQFLPHLERVVMSLPHAEKRLEDLRQMSKRLAEAAKTQTDAANA